MRKREAMPFLALMAAGLVARLIDLGDRPFHHDESQDAYFSWWYFFDDGDYEYDPLLHGPLRFYLTAAVYAIFGDSDFTARLAPALMGTILIGLPFFLRRQLGMVAAVSASALIAFTPTFLYYSRFAREDIYIAAINMALIVVAFRYLERPWRWGPAAMLGLIAAAFATKETTFITLFVAGAFFLPAAAGWVGIVLMAAAAPIAFVLLDEPALMAVVVGSLAVSTAGWEIARRRHPADPPDARLRERVAAVGAGGWGWGAAAFVLVFVLLFAALAGDVDGVRKGAVDGLKYWLDQQDVARGGEPWYFYIVVLFGHEWPVLLLGAVGAVAVALRPTLIGFFAMFAFACSLAVYSWASEKFAWLALHPLMPLILLAGIGVQALLTIEPRRLRLVAVPLLVVCAAYTGYATFSANALHRADPREFLVSTQSSEDVKTVVDRVENLDRRVRRKTGQGVTITIDTVDGATYPWAWYFRHKAVNYIEMTADGYVPQSQVLIMTEQSRQALTPTLQAYEGGRFRFRVWWVRDWSRKLSPGAWWDWLIRREKWNEGGGMPEWIFVRRDAAAS